MVTTSWVYVECEWVLKPSCTDGRAFIALMHAMQNEEILTTISEQVPKTIEVVQVNALSSP